MVYPAADPYNDGYLKVSDLHNIYYAQSGNPEGKPVIFLHGGPGGGTDTKDTVYFDPKVYRVVRLDQRGSGKSTPPAELEGNDTWSLVADIEALREKLGIDKWMVFGGSWGSTLTLAYSQTHPERCTALIMRGIFMLRRSELEFFYQNGTSHLFPEAWDDYVAPIPEAERFDMMKAYYTRLTSPDATIRIPAAKAWSKWEMSTSRLRTNAEDIAKAEADDWAFRHLPCITVQGRYDVVCPARSAYDLKKVWGEGMQLKIVDDAGHSAKEDGIKALLVQAADEFAAM
ncbi:proline iminopeptidase, partial [Tremellales sp. Uapishka_1]